MAEVLKKFGRYFLFDQIAQGGMAEIYRARLASTDGAGRLIVIKRIQAGYGNNPEFLQMFRSEIKVTMGFNHPNIVQLYDFGEEQGQPYIAMELLDGKNLRQFMNRFNEMKQVFPVELAVYIVEQAASGLHYAHSFKDKISGKPLSIVHRDVSPQNILISFEGNIKVIDFGIAKASTNSESTRAGVIKGKPSYLSPEQISGEQLDGRSDIFALGIVLWELLVGRKLFAGDNDLAVLKLIESSQTHVKPPSTHNPKVPKELDAIVLKALSKQRDKRYQTAEELQRALHRFLYSFSPEFNPTDLSYQAKDLFKNEIVEDRKRIQRLNEEVEKLLIASELVVHTPVNASGGAGQGGTDSSDHTKHTHTLLDERATSTTPLRGPEAEYSMVKSGPIEFENSSKIDLNRRDKRGRSGDQHATVGYRPQTRTDVEAKKSGWANSAFYGAAAVAVLAFFGPSLGFEIPFLSRLLGQGHRPASVSNPGASDVIKYTDQGAILATVSKSVQLHLNIVPSADATVATINGKSVSMSNPVITVPVDSPLELSVQSPSFKSIQRQFVVNSADLGDRKEWTMDIEMDPTNFGYLTIRTNPSADATITIDGKTWKRRTPFEKEKLPIGSYTVKLSNELLEMERTLSIQIKDGETTQPFDPDRESTHEVKLNMVGRLPGSVKNQ